MASPKICFVAPNLYPVFAKLSGSTMVGGAEIQQTFLLRELAARGYDLSVLSADFGQGAEMELEGVRFIRMFEASAGLAILKALHPRMTGVWAALKRADADVYYNRCASMSLALVSEYCARYGRKNIFAGASDLDFIPGSELIRAPWYRAMYRHGLRRTRHIVVQNPTQAQLCLTNYGRESELIPSVFVPPSDLPLAPARVEVLWCGVLREAKRVELFLELVKQLPQYRFRIVGGPDSSAYSQAIAEHIQVLSRTLPNLAFDGFLPYAEADAKFLEAKLFVNSSAREGFPNTFLQAWSRGIPTLSFVDVGARVKAGAVGVICAELDELVDAVQRLMDDAALYAEHSSRALDYFHANHTVDACVSKYEEVLL